jgi:hypothetical protein
MKHVLIAGLSVLASVGLDISLHFFGAHDVGGLLAMLLGFPGLLANGEYTRLNEPLFISVNAGFYFLVFEAIAALKQKLLKRSSPQTPD